MEDQIKSLIAKYAEVYGEFEALQTGGKLASGDQKTGVIAEYYAKCYIEKVLQLEVKNYEKPGAAFDIRYLEKNGNEVRVQVKAVSAHSKTLMISPIKLKGKDGKSAFDKLYLFKLSENFTPVSFWINDYQWIIENAKTRNSEQEEPIKIASAYMKQPNRHLDLNEKHDLIEKLNAII